ncbi:hypothetical protein ACFW04_006055 [Cataglyphis niger]
MWKIIVLCTILGLAIAEKARFNNYKVFRIIPTTEAQVEILRELEEISDGFSFWETPSFVGRNVDLMVAPHKLPQFYELMAQIGIPHQIHIEDVQALIDETTPMIRSKSFDFTSYHTLDEIYKYLDDLAKNSDKVNIIIGGKTYEGRQIKGVKLSFKENNPGVFIEGGIHAREWISPATVMYFLNDLLTSNNTDVRALAERYDWYIFPSFNPDGYVYTHTTNRMWRKTRKPYGLICTGSDPNRNWDYKWMRNSTKPCSNSYAGNAPFSEIETRSISRYIKTISDKFYAYIAFHSHAQLLLFPYGHTKDHLDNYDELVRNFSTNNKKFLIKIFKNVLDNNLIISLLILTLILYMATGSSVDYIKATYDKKITYIYELRDRDHCGYLLPPDQIIPTGEEIMDSLVVMFKEVKARGHPFKNF